MTRKDNLLAALRAHFREETPVVASQHLSVGETVSAVRGAARAVLERQIYELGDQADELSVFTRKQLELTLAELPLIVDAEFVRELLDHHEAAPERIPSRANEHAVVAGDVIVAVGATPADAVNDYAATGLEVRADGAGGWEALSVSDIDWQPVRVIRISPELADHIRQHGAPDSWDTIDGVAHLEREYA